MIWFYPLYMGNIGGWIPWLLLGGVLLGGFLLLRTTGQFLSDPKGQKLIHALTSQEFKQIIQDQANGLITQDEANARVKALSERSVNMARYSR